MAFQVSRRDEILQLRCIVRDCNNSHYGKSLDNVTLGQAGLSDGAELLGTAFRDRIGAHRHPDRANKRESYASTQWEKVAAGLRKARQKRNGEAIGWRGHDTEDHPDGSSFEDSMMRRKEKRR